MNFRVLIVVVAACIGLGACELLFDVGALEGTGIGAGEVGAAMNSGVVGGGALAGDSLIGEAVISDDLTTVADGAKLTPEMEGELSGILRRWTADGTQIGRVAIGDTGYLHANGYVVARVAPDGALYAPNGLKLGRFSGLDGRLYEYLENGSQRPIGALEAFTANDGVHVYANVFGDTVVRILKPGSVVEVIGIENGRYLVRLVNGSTGWIPKNGIVALTLIGLGQTRHHCPDRDGVAVLRSGESIHFKRCKERDDAFLLSSNSEVIRVQRADLAYFLEGDGVTDDPRESPRYILAYNGATRYRVPPDAAFDQRPIGAQSPRGVSPPAPSPFIYKGQ